MKKNLGWIFAISTVLAGATTANAKHQGYIIKLKNNAASQSEITARLKEVGVTVTDSIPKLNMVVTDVAPDMSQPNVRSATRNLIAYVEPNYTRQISMKSSNLSFLQGVMANEAEFCWGMGAIHAADAWKISTGDRKILVAVSDTGGWEHAELVPNYWSNPGETGLDAQGKDKAKNGIDDDHNGFIDDVRGWNFSGNSKNTNDAHYHGTHVSGTIGAYGGDKTGVAGVSWKVSIMEVPFIGSDGSGSDANAIKSIVYAADMGARALNASWGGTDAAQALFESVEYARSKGMLFIAAAGNDGVNNDKEPHYPSSYPSDNIISVAAMNQSSQITGWSNYGLTSVDLGAPGDEIYSTWNPMYSMLYRYFYYSISGTSMAAPHVTGAAALIWSINPSLNYKQVRSILMNTVTPNKDLKGRTVTGGTLNLSTAANMALQTK